MTSLFTGVSGIILLIFTPIGIVLNILSAVLLAYEIRHARMRASTSQTTLLLSLSVADGAFLTFLLLTTICFVCEQAIFGLVVLFLMYLFYSISRWIVVSVNMDRYLGIRHTIWARMYCTRSTARFQIFLMVGLGVLESSVAITLMSLGMISGVFILQIVRGLITCTAVVVLNVSLVVFAASPPTTPTTPTAAPHQTASWTTPLKTGQKKTAASRRESERSATGVQGITSRTTKRLLAVSILFILCESPCLIISCYYLSHCYDGSDHHKASLPYPSNSTDIGLNSISSNLANLTTIPWTTDFKDDNRLNSTFTDSTPKASGDATVCDVFFGIVCALAVLAVTDSSLNFFLYCLAGESFRKNFVKVFIRPLRCCRRQTVSNNGHPPIRG